MDCCDDLLDDGPLFPGALDGEHDLTPRLFLMNVSEYCKAPLFNAPKTRSSGWTREVLFRGEDDEKKRFPEKLVELLSDPGLAEVIRWESKALVVLDARRFVNEIVPQYFSGTRTKSLKSFHRQLNYYGFEVQRGASISCLKSYVHRDPTILHVHDLLRLTRYRPKRRRDAAPDRRLKMIRSTRPTSLPCALPSF
ncbi:hypothetical protein CTAYLR_001044 [Chrysophaeum taylorii]|uniref:HSF-type DNA-binding domain-containing protein n=1 Tax=Chrysophaeum taylorii TaxID=2483200 RepID=A0AAD7UFJ8_9STRA|nr:hypothetical protein CTAYLR_001044 [Chrysophaeum taylorii]